MGVVRGSSMMILECDKVVVCALCMGGVVLGRGLLTPSLASLLTGSLPKMPEWVQIFGNVCYDSLWIIACISNLLEWLCWREG